MDTRKQSKGSFNFHKGLVFATCYAVMLLYVGLLYSIGSIFVDIMSTFNATRAQTSVIYSTTMAVGLGSVFVGVSVGLSIIVIIVSLIMLCSFCSTVFSSFVKCYNQDGFLSGLIIHKFGILRCGVVASCLASFGIMSCYFATSTFHMTIGFGILFAIGFSCLYICAATAIGQHFNGKRKLLVLSLQATGGAVGGMMYPYVLRYLSETYGFRGGLLIVGGFTLNCAPACLLWKLPKRKGTEHIVRENSDRLKQYQQNLQLRVTTIEDDVTILKNKNISQTKDNDLDFIDKFPVIQNDSKTRRVSIQPGDFSEKSSVNETEDNQTLCQSVKALINNARFMIFVLGCVLANPSIGLIIIFIADVFTDKGLTIEDATFGLLLMNIVNIIGRILPGLMMQAKHVPTMFCPLLASLSATVVLLGFSFTTTRLTTLIVCAVTGVPIGMFVTMFSVVSAKLVGTKSLPTAIGILFSANGIGNAVAGPISGYIRDIYGSYSIPLYSAAGMTLFASMLFFIAWGSQKRQKKITRRRSSIFYLTSM